MEFVTSQPLRQKSKTSISNKYTVCRVPEKEATLNSL